MRSLRTLQIAVIISACTSYMGCIKSLDCSAQFKACAPDAGASPSACEQIAGKDDDGTYRSVCATSGERSRAVLSVVHERQQRTARDGGPQ